MKYEVVVGNVGTIPAKSIEDAIGIFNEYVINSRDNAGRAAGESVCIMLDGDILHEFDYIGKGAKE